MLFDQLVAQGVEPNVANCGISTAYETKSEEELLAMGIATPTPEALAIVIQGALDCGIPQEALSSLRCEIEPMRSRFGAPGAYNAGLLGFLESQN